MNIGSTFLISALSITLVNSSLKAGSCADHHTTCRDGTPTFIDMHWSWGAGRCVPMLHGGGHSLDVVIDFCNKNHHKGLSKKNVPPGDKQTEGEFAVLMGALV